MDETVGKLGYFLGSAAAGALVSWFAARHGAKKGAEESVKVVEERIGEPVSENGAPPVPIIGQLKNMMDGIEINRGKTEQGFKEVKGSIKHLDTRVGRLEGGVAPPTGKRRA